MAEEKKEEKQKTQEAAQAQEKQPEPKSEKEQKKEEAKPETKKTKETKETIETKEPSAQPSPKEVTKKKVNKMTLEEIEVKLKEIQEKMGGLDSLYAKHLLRRQELLTNKANKK